MIGFRQKVYQTARRLFDNGEIEQAESAVSPLWDEYPYDEMVFQLLLEIYTTQKKWSAAELLILQYQQNIGYQPVVNESFLNLYLNMGAAEKAWENAEKIIAEAPDFAEGINEIGYKFGSAGLGDVFLRKIADSTVPGLQKHLVIAGYHYAIGAYEQAISVLEAALLLDPADEEAHYTLEHYRASVQNQKRDLARSILAGDVQGDFVQVYQQVYQLSPQSVVAQEYYLSALACKIFPPFRIYFYGGNFIGLLPYGGKAVVFLIFFLMCAIYYKNGIADGERDHLQSVIYFFSGLAIPRYLIFPLVVQLLSFKYVPGFHLLKRPVHFLNGSIILATWMQVFVLANRTTTNGFEYFLAACMMLYVVLFSVGSNKQLQKWVIGYGLVAITLGLLAYFRIIHDGFLFLFIAGWVVPFLVAALSLYLQKLKDTYATLKEHPSATADVDTLKAPKVTFVVHIVSLTLAVVGVVLFILSKNNTFLGGIPLLFVAFPMTMHSITVFGFTETNSEPPDWGWLFQNEPIYRLSFILFSIGMYVGSILLGTNGHVPIRESLGWIPAAVLFFGSWALLFYLTYRFKNKYPSV